MKVIGVTGGVGSGKSVVLSILEEEYQAKVILTDLVAHDLMQIGQRNYVEIVKEFGTDILQEDKSIDRKKLGKIVFEDKEKLERLNQITHPGVKQEVKEIVARIKQEGKASMILLESALLLEAGYEDIYDEIWYVYVEKEVRYQRLLDGRGYTREKTDSIIKNQLSEKEFRAKADVVIDNSGSLEETKVQIKKILEGLHFVND